MLLLTRTAQKIKTSSIDLYLLCRVYSDLDCVVSNGNGLAMVKVDFNASVSKRMKREVGPHRLGRQR